MTRNIFKSFFLTILCIFVISSCAYLSENTGSIEFSLPSVSNSDLERSAVNGTFESDYRVVVESKQGNVIYDKRHPGGSFVEISNIEVGYYKIFISRESATHFYKGYADVVVNWGKESFVDIKLNSFAKPGSISINFSFGQSKPASVIPLKLSVVNVSTNKAVELGDNANLTSNDSSIFVKGLTAGSYNISIEGRFERTAYKASTKIPVFVNNGENKSVDLVLNASSNLLFVDGYKGDDKNTGMTNSPLASVSKAVEIIEGKDPEGKETFEIVVRGSILEKNTIEIKKPLKIILYQEAGQDNVNVTNSNGTLLAIDNAGAEITLNGVILRGGVSGGTAGCVNVNQGTFIMNKGAINENFGSDKKAVSVKSGANFKLGKAGKINGNIYLEGDSFVTLTETRGVEETSIITLEPSSGYSVGRKVIAVENGANVSSYGRFRLGNSGYYIKSDGCISDTKDITVNLQNVNGATSAYPTILTCTVNPGNTKVEVPKATAFFVIPGLKIGTTYSLNILGNCELSMEGKLYDATYTGTGNVTPSIDCDSVKVTMNSELKPKPGEPVTPTTGGLNISLTGSEIPSTAKIDVKKADGSSITGYPKESVSTFPHNVTGLEAGTYTVSVSGEDSSLFESYSGSAECVVEVGNDSKACEVAITASPTTVYYVDGGVGTGGSGTDGSKLDTIQAAVNKIVEKNKTSQVGYTIKVTGNGGKVAINNNSNPQLDLTIEGVGQGAEINGAGTARALDSGNSTVITLKNIKITGGTSSQGGGIYISSSSRVNLEDGVIISGNTDSGTEGGAGIYMGAGTSETNSAILTFSGKVEVSDEIFLKIPNDYSTAKILVAGTLTGTTQNQIKLNDYTTAKNKPIIGTTASGSLDSVSTRFTIVNTAYSIDTSGKLVDAGSIPVPSKINTWSDLSTAITDAADGATVIIPGVSGSSKILSVDAPISIDKNITLTTDVTGSVKLDRHSAAEFFNIASGKKLTINGINFDGRSRSSQTATHPFIICEGSLEIKNSKLENNNNTAKKTEMTSEYQNAAAIYFGKQVATDGNTLSSYGSLTLTNTKILNNTLGDTSKDGRGVVTIFANGEPKNEMIVTMNNCFVSGNTSAYGTINIQGNIKADITDTEISNNTVSKNGGGIAAKKIGNLPTVNLSGETIICGNKANTGAGMYMNDVHLNVSGNAKIIGATTDTALIGTKTKNGTTIEKNVLSNNATKFSTLFIQVNKPEVSTINGGTPAFSDYTDEINASTK